jgi:hypothetical protein
MVAWLKGRYPNVVWVHWLDGGQRGCGVGILVVHGSSMAQDLGIPLCMGLVQSCGLVQPKGQRAQQNGAAALQTYRAGIWQAGYSLLDRGMEKPSTI